MEHKKHKLKESRWRNGMLQVKTSFFERLEDAILFAQTLIGCQIKIYDEEEVLVHSCSDHDCCETYA